MSQTPATRTQLLRTKKQIKLANKGYQLLKKKRDGMIKAFFEVINDYKKLREGIEEELRTSYKTIQKAIGVSGSHRLKSMSMSAKNTCEIEFKINNLMGVKVPHIKVEVKKGSLNASLLGTSYYVEQAHTQFSELLPKIILLAEKKQVIYSLAEEIKKVKRRVNSLEHIHIPKLQQEQKRIRMQLSELEREEFVRLKHVKKILEQA